MSLGISLLAAVSGCKTDDDGTQLLMTSLGPARSAQSGLHSEQVVFYWYLNCKIMVGIFHSKIKLYLPLLPHTRCSYNNILHLMPFLVLSRVWLGVLQLHGGLVIFQEHSVHFVVISSILLLDYIAQYKLKSTLNGVIHFRCVSLGGKRKEKQLLWIPE